MSGQNDDHCFKYYRYDPSLAAAILFTISFLITTLLHTYQLIRTKTWIVIPLIVGGFCMSLLQDTKTVLILL